MDRVRLIKKEESAAPRPCSPRRRAEFFPLVCARISNESRLGNRGEYRAECVLRMEIVRRRDQKDTRGMATFCAEPKNKAPNRRARCLKSAIARASGGKPTHLQATYRLDGGHYR